MIVASGRIRPDTDRHSRPSMPFPTVTRIEAPRLFLRPVAAPDLPDLQVVNGDPEVTRFLPYETWRAPADAEAWLARMEAMVAAGTGQVFVLVRRSDERVVGTLLLFKYDEGSARVELGYVLGRAAWRQGLMREAVAAACATAFDELGMRRIEAEVHPENVASCALLLQAGFTLEGTLRQRWRAKGETYDTHMYGLLAEDRKAAGRS
jgi:ribosomal-protein-alanine N-acetyltransferase